MSPTTVYFDMIIHGGLELDEGKVKFRLKTYHFTKQTQTVQVNFGAP